MNKDEELYMDSVEPNQFIIGKEDNELLQAVKNLLKYAHIRVPNGDNAKLKSRVLVTVTWLLLIKSLAIQQPEPANWFIIVIN